MLKTRAPASPGIGPEEGTRRAPIKSPWVNKLQGTKITTWPRRISECLSYICSLKKNTAILHLFGVEQVTPDKLSIYFNKLGCMVLPESFNK